MCQKEVLFLEQEQQHALIILGLITHHVTFNLLGCIALVEPVHVLTLARHPRKIHCTLHAWNG